MVLVRSCTVLAALPCFPPSSFANQGSYVHAGFFDDMSEPSFLLGSHEVAPLLWVSADGKEGVFLRPFQKERYARQQFGFVGFRFVTFQAGTDVLVSFCSAPTGRCPDMTSLEPVFSGKDYLLNTVEEVSEQTLLHACHQGTTCIVIRVLKTEGRELQGS